MERKDKSHEIYTKIETKEEAEQKGAIKTKNKKEGKNKKFQHLGGEAFESIISYEVTKKFFIEDFNEVDKNLDFCHGQELDIDKIKTDIMEKLAPNENYDFARNKEKLSILTGFCGKVNNFYGLKANYNSIYISSESYSSDNLSPSINEKKNSANNSNDNNSSNNKKNISKLEFDLILKNVDGKKVINFLKEMEEKKRLFIFKKIKNLEESKNYNICIEITIDSADIITKKIPQLYKTVSCMNFLYETYNYFKGFKNSISDSYRYFQKKTDFIDYNLDLILMTISNGKRNIFEKIEEETKKLRSISNSAINCLDNLNKNYNIYMLYYPNYADEELDKLNLKVEKQKTEINELKKSNEQQQQKINEQEQKINEQQTKINEMQQIINEMQQKMKKFFGNN